MLSDEPTSTWPETQVSLATRVEEYAEWMALRNFAPSTVIRVRRALRAFTEWAEGQAIRSPGDVHRPLLERYAKHLHDLRTGRGLPLSFETQYGELSNLRCFFRHLARKGHIAASPAGDLELPKLAQRLPPTAMSHAEVMQVVAGADITTGIGLRDRAIMETFYSSGLRRAELTGLTLLDLDLGRGALTVRRGKGGKDRVVPVGSSAAYWIEQYVRIVRPTLVLDPNERTLFLSAYGQPLSKDGLTYRVAKYIDAAKIGRHGSCHLFRHSMATLMLERGADIRIIQEILGHASLETTQLYTHVSITHLKEVHARTHPGGALSARRPF